jgi:hypothetical protein
MSPRFTRQSQGALLRKPVISFRNTHTGLSPSTAELSRTPLLRRRGERPAPYTTSTPARRGSVQFRLFPFRSLLLRKSQLVSFPPLTRMFRFGGFPLLTERRPKASGSPIRASPDHRLHASTRGLSQLATPFFSTQAKPSIRQRSISAYYPVPQLESKPMHGFIVSWRFPGLHRLALHPRTLRSGDCTYLIVMGRATRSSPASLLLS